MKDGEWVQQSTWDALVRFQGYHHDSREDEVSAWFSEPSFFNEKYKRDISLKIKGEWNLILLNSWIIQIMLIKTYLYSLNEP